MIVPNKSPAGGPVTYPTPALQDAITKEWSTRKAYSPSGMPLTALLYTALDQIEGNEEMITEVMLAYIDTDTLCYRSTHSDALKKKQEAQWDPLLQWASTALGSDWEVAEGVMPIEQPKKVHDSLRQMLAKLNAYELSAISMVASLCSSIILALALYKREINAEDAFILSRLEESTQQEQWGVDVEAQQRAAALKAEIVIADRFLRLLEGA